MHVGAGAIGVYPYGVRAVLSYTVPMKRESRSEAAANALIFSSLQSKEKSITMGVHFAKPAPKRERKPKSIFHRFFFKGK